MWMNSFTWNLVVGALFTGALVLLLYAGYFAVRGRPYPPRRNPKRLAVVAVLSGTLGLLAHAATNPRAATNVTERGAVMSNEARFDSPKDPALTIDAPLGWTVQFDRPKHLVRVVKGDAASADPPAMLSIDTSLLKDEANTEHLAEGVRSALASRGFVVSEQAFPDIVAGMTAHGVIGHTATGDLCSWVVKRGLHYVASVQCFARGGADCRQACKPPLDRLHWRTPTDILAVDL
jgi:hypothetical protein